MLRKFFKNKIGQNTAEYALLIALVVAGVIAMQTYAQRSLQSRMRDASNYLATHSSNAEIGLSNTVQYEPYYLSSNYSSLRNASDSKILDTDVVKADSSSNRIRKTDGFQVSNYVASGKDAPSGL